MMTKLISLITLITLLASCNGSSDASKPICDTVCLSDTVVFRSNKILEPYVKIILENCNATRIIWSHSNSINHRRIEVSDYIKKQVRINQVASNSFFKDADYLWLTFNDCITSRGYALKLPFNKKDDILCYSSALNRFDPKFVVADGLICYSNYRYVYVEDVATGKAAKLELSKTPLNIDFNTIHETFDSVNVSHYRIFVKMKDKDPLETTISL